MRSGLPRALPFVFIFTSLLTACGSQPAQPVGSTPTPSPIPSLTPASSPTPLPTLTSTPVPNGPCDNPLLPLVSGNQWSYLVTGGLENYPYVLTVGERQDIGNINIDVEMLDEKHARDVSELVVCRDGAIDNFPLHVMSMLLSDYLDGILNTYKESGLYAPAYPDFLRNEWTYTWQLRYLVEESVAITDPVGGSALFLRPNDPIDVSFETQGKNESVTVPAGTFPQSLAVSNDYTMAVTIVVGDITTSGELALHTSQWYVPYIGLVRAQVDSASVSIMPGQASSMPIRSVLELLSFTPGR